MQVRRTSHITSFINNTEIGSVTRHTLLEYTPNSLPFPVSGGLTESAALYLLSPSASYLLIGSDYFGRSMESSIYA